MADTQWIDLGPVEELKTRPLRHVICGKTPIALTYKDGRFSAISGVCNHVGGPLGDGALDGDYVVCPWHYWKFHRQTGQGEPGYEDDCVPAYAVKVEREHVYVDLSSATKRKKKPHANTRWRVRSFDRMDPSVFSGFPPP